MQSYDAFNIATWFVVNIEKFSSISGAAAIISGFSNKFSIVLSKQAYSSFNGRISKSGSNLLTNEMPKSFNPANA